MSHLSNLKFFLQHGSFSSCRSFRGENVSWSRNFESLLCSQLVLSLLLRNERFYEAVRDRMRGGEGVWVHRSKYIKDVGSLKAGGGLVHPPTHAHTAADRRRGGCCCDAAAVAASLGATASRRQYDNQTATFCSSGCDCLQKLNEVQERDQKWKVQESRTPPRRN